MAYAGYTEAHKAANKRYNEKRERIYLMVSSETKQRIMKNARQENKSTTAYILNAIEEYEDDAFCQKLYQDYLDDPDREKTDAVNIEDFAAELGINL